MKIGFSTFVLQGGQSGVSTYVRNLLRFLQVSDAENEYRLLMARDEADLVPLSNPQFTKRLTPSFANRPLANLIWHNTVLAGLSRKLDLLHVPGERRIPMIKGTRVVATVHDLAAFHVERKYGRKRMFFNRHVVPSMIRRADHLIAVSESTKSDIIRYAGYPEERISVVYSGVDHDLFHPVPKQEALDRLQMLQGLEHPFIVYVSRLEHPAKNHIRLIEAFEQFKLANDSAYQLVLAGADWHGAEEIRARAAASPVHEDIIFTGFVPLKTLQLLYSGCDLMVFPSLFEGFGFPIIEALACGAPVICSATSSMKELAGRLLPTFDPLDASAISRCMEQSVASGWSEASREKALDYARTFDWRETARHVMDIYSRLA